MDKLEISKLTKVNKFLTAITPNKLQNKFFQHKRVMEKFQVASRLTGTEHNVWVEFGKLATDCKALNLGQGFPDFYPPKFVTDALETVSKDMDNYHLHQYTRSYGHPRLISAVAKRFSKELSRQIDPLTEVLITVGAYGSLFFAAQGLVNHGDEVIIIEPFFDSYEPMVKQAGGIPRYISLNSSKAPGEVTTTADWTFDREELKSLFNTKTKLLIFNNPNNPLGKVYTEDEMTFIADLCKQHNVVVVSDEVYDRLVYPESKFIRMANLPGMYERTLTIGSAGKTFSVTGWKLGWTIGPAHLVKALCYVHQNCNYTCATPLQEAVAICFEREEREEGKQSSYFHQAPREIVPKKDKIMRMLQKIDIAPIEPQAGYFIVGDISKTGFKVDPSNPESKDYQFVKWICRTKGVSAIPNSAFYSQQHKPLASDLVRFCFFKKEETLENAEKIFENWNKK